MAEVEATKVETEKVVDPTPPAAEAPKEAERVVETPKEVADEKAIVAPALPPPEEVKEKSDDSKALVVVEDSMISPYLVSVIMYFSNSYYMFGYIYSVLSALFS